MSSSSNLAEVDCDKLVANLRVYLERWWQSKNKADERRYGKKAEKTYLSLWGQCVGDVAGTYQRMLADVMKLPKGKYFREVEAMEKEGRHGYVVKVKKTPPNT